MSGHMWFNRRAILVGGGRALLAAILGSRFGGAVPGAQERKPRLRNEEFNKHFVSLRGTRQFAGEMADAKADLAAYLSRHFEPTAAQLRNVKAFPDDEVRALNAALDRAVAEGLTLKLLASDGPCRGIQPRFSPGTLTIEITH